MKYIKWFDQIAMDDVPAVGGKNASLGQMIQHLKAADVEIPFGFAVTAQAYWHHIDENNLRQELKKELGALKDYHDIAQLQKVGARVRELIYSGTLPDDLAQEILGAYRQLSERYKMDEADVAVRSSATAEDLPTASFAGQQETFLNVRGDEVLLDSCKKSMASLFTDRAIVYRIEQGFDHFKVALSVGVQKMIRSDQASAGVAFTVDTETGFKDVVMIESSYGLGETIVKGLVAPDVFVVHKPTLKKGFASIIKKSCGKKDKKLIYDDPVRQVDVSDEDQNRFSLSDQEIISLGQMCVAIEDHYSELKKQWMPMDVEWAKDGDDGKLYIVQARPETVHGSKQKEEAVVTSYQLDEIPPEPIVVGQSIGQQIVSGVARVVHDLEGIHAVQKGDILVTKMTDPDWVPVMKKAAGIITDLGGRTCHAAIVSRELGVPAIVGTLTATELIKDGVQITIDCSRGAQGYVLPGELSFSKKEVVLETLPKLETELMMNIADPDRAFVLSFLPVTGVGLARVEFIISSAVKVHPMALVHPEKITDADTLKHIENITNGYDNKKEFFIDGLAHGIAMIAAAFYPRPVIVRLSDFKSNEYHGLIGGQYFEPEEENPMLGFRGASRYYHEAYQEAFALECAALKKVRETMGLENVKVMVPFVRTVSEAQAVIAEMKKHGVEQGAHDLELVMMVEVPSNVVLIEKFAQHFDGFSIGSNDLTQLVLGVDRDSALLAETFDERDEAVKIMMAQAIEGAHKHKRFIGICGQAPSDYPEIGEFLMSKKIDSLSLNPDSVLPFLLAQK